MFFLPGFISLKIYDLFVPNDRRDFSKQFLDAVAYSLINFVILIPLFDNFLGALGHNQWLLVWLYGVLFALVGPIFWPLIYIKLTKWKSISKHIVAPIKKPWDWFFSKKEPLWTIVELSDGRKIGGIFAKNSYASSYPAEEQIYLEKVWKLDNEGKFLKNGRINGSKGIIILGKDISSIEFFETEEE
jgi:hypothetical protein